MSTSARFILVLLCLPFICIGQEQILQQQDLGGIVTFFADIDQAPNGIIWFADNQRGLVQYDGFEAVANPQDDSRYNRLETVDVDATGTVWAGTWTYGVYAYDPQLESYTYLQTDSEDPRSLRNDSVRSVLIDSEGLIWIGTSAGLDIFNPENESFNHMQGQTQAHALLGNGYIRTILEDSNGIIWIGSGSAFAQESKPAYDGLYRYDKTTGDLQRFTSENSGLVDHQVISMFEDSYGTLWIGTVGDGLHTMDVETEEITHHALDPNDPMKLSRAPLKEAIQAANHITFFNEDDEGLIWIGTFSSGISRYNPVTGHTTHLTSDDGVLPFDYFWTSLKANDGTLWLGPRWDAPPGKDLFKYDAKINVTEYVHLGQVSHSFYENAFGVWIGTDNGMFLRKKDGSHEQYLNGHFVFPFYPTGDGDSFWIGEGDGVGHFDPVMNKYKHYPIPGHSFVISLLQEGDTALLAGTPNGFDRLNLTTNETTHLHNQGALGFEVRTLLHESGGMVMIGSTYFLTGRKGNVNKSYFRNGITVNSLIEDSRNIVWAGTSNGLYRYDRSRDAFDRAFDHTGVLETVGQIYSIAEDLDGRIWLISDQTIVLFDPSVETATKYGKTWFKEESIINKDRIFTTSEGKIAIGDGTGYYLFVPARVGEGKVTVPYIKRLRVDEVVKSVPGLGSRSGVKRIQLPYNENNLSLDFGVADFQTHPSDISVQYRLLGLNSNWQGALGLGTASYLNVPPGSYTFQVKSSNLYGLWGEEELTIMIMAPWYEAWWAWVIYGSFFVVFIFGVHKVQRARVIRAERERQKDKELEQAKEVEKAYTQLKETQKQLIQSEKMASLGELTAGIAHEIQNPLNFVNNFSEVSADLIDEMQEGLDSGDSDEVRDIAKDLKDNLQKITHHGERASGIVKGMLSHSRTSDGSKETVDVNVLADEYLRLAYHGLRAKDKSFQAEFSANLQENLPTIQAVPQDIGRVILNLVNNAFQSVYNRSKTEQDYAPLVTVTTRSIGDHVEIGIKDNGGGIPDDLKEKIFEPFFTTKSPGEGTGLGLSLSYDIVTKGHQGKLHVNSEKGKGTAFIIELPI